jgi:hypothetical protein
MPIITVTGKVASSSATLTGKGLIKFWEKSNFKGQDKFVLWTAWFDMPQLHVGENDEITINGRLSTKIGNYKTKDTGEEREVVDHHLNDSIIQGHVSAVAFPADPMPIDDIEVPF